jgi:hypothetical protein
VAKLTSMKPQTPTVVKKPPLRLSSRIRIWKLAWVIGFAAVQPIDASATPDATVANCDTATTPYNPAAVEMLSLVSTFGGAAISAALFSAGAATPGTSEGLLIAGGIVGGLAGTVGPGVGHLYIGKIGWTLGRMGVRMALLGLGIYAGFRWIDSAICSDYCEDEGAWGLPVMILSSSAFTFLFAWDFATIRRRTREANAEAKQQKSVAVAITPALLGAQSGGILLSGSF